MTRTNTLPWLSIILCLLAASTGVFAQENVHPQSGAYEWPEDPLVREKLEKWQDQKFGMIIHWGLYAVPGMIESWALCNEEWISRDSTTTYEGFKKWYWGLNEKFNPVGFDPDQWALAAQSAGMRYVVFTTKHHDGFNMFDTKQTDFKITAGPFKSHPKANVAKYVFDAFRKQHLMIGAYYSKPDWHSEYYWWPTYATADRNNNYDIRKNPWRWNQFKQFTYNQIEELMTDYGAMDILWLDGGWVRPLNTVTDEVRAWGAAIPAWSQDIDIPRIAAMARKKQPGLLVVDRTVHGQYENYQTPEQRIPDAKLNHPWETCMTLGYAWGYVPNEKFKSSTTVIHTLIEVVAKGGNLLLGVGPDANGLLSDAHLARLKDIGNWLNENGAAIYNTRATEVYHSGETFFTQSKDGKITYALVRLPEGKVLPGAVTWKGTLAKNAKVKLVATGKAVKWKQVGENVEVTLPASFHGGKPYAAVALAIER